MKGENPYEPPSPEKATFRRPPDGPNLWRDGRFLVAALDAEFPPRCVKCNRPSGSGRLRRSLKPAGGEQRVTFAVDLGLCEKHLRRARMRESWPGVGLLLVVLGLIGLTSMRGPAEQPWVASLLLGLGPLVWLLGPLQLRRATVSLAKAEPPFLWLGGVCREFLDQLPHVPSGSAAEP